MGLSEGINGAAGGAAMGSAAGPWGALAGGAIGLTAGLLSKPKQYGYSKGDLEALAGQRATQIDSFSKQLAASRANYLATMQQLAPTTFNNLYGPDKITQMAAMGLNPNGGATQSALARIAMGMQGDIYNTAFNAEQNDLMAVDNAYGQNSAAQMGAATQNFSAPVQNPLFGQLGQLGGQAAMGYLNNKYNTQRDQAFINALRSGGSSPSFNGTTSRNPLNLNY